MIKLAVVGTGGMGAGHARVFSGMKGVKVVAVCDRDRGRATLVAKELGIPEVYDDVKALIRSADFDAVTNVTSDASHCATSLPLIAAGKHILCEKPLATHYADARRMARAAARKGVINMVNFSYRNSSALQRAHQLVQEGAIGDIRHFEASYLQGWLGGNWGDWSQQPRLLWRLSSRHGSKGTLGDLGVHIVDFASFPSGDIKSVNCRFGTFPKAPGNRVGEYRFDANDSVIITAELRNGAIGTIHTTRWATGHSNSLLLRLYGTQGGIIIDLDAAYGTLRICNGKGAAKNAWRTVKCGKTPSISERFVRSVRTGINDQPDFARGAAIQKVLDACFESDKTGQTVKV